MKRLLTLLIPLMLFIFSSCENSSDPTLIDDKFQGITRTGEQGPEPLGGDQTDWCSNHILQKGKDDNVDIPIPLNFSFGPAYPNPCERNLNLKIPLSLDVQQHVYIYIIDRNYSVIKVLINSLLMPGSHEIMVPGSEIGAGVHRMIIETSAGITCFGDIWIR